MERNYEQELAERIGRELRQLPPPQAPATLAPRVLAAIEARARQPWWKKSWVHWPGGFSVVFLLGSLVLAGGVIYTGASLVPAISFTPVLDGLENRVGFLSPETWPLVSACGTAFAAVVRSGGSLFLWSALAAGAAMYLTCVGLGTLCYRVALNKI